MKISEQKQCHLNKLQNEDGIISALAFDQRGALSKMIQKHQEEKPSFEQMSTLKKLVSEELTKYSSAILLDPEFGQEAIKVVNKNCGLILAYEKTGYDATTTTRLPDCLDDFSVKRLKDMGADAIKFLLYYDVDGDKEVNKKKQVYMERIGSECLGEDIPFFLEIVSYSEDIADTSSIEYSRLRPHKIIEAMKEFSKPQYHVDILKVEVPVNMNYVDGFEENIAIHTKEEAAKYFKEQAQATHLPYIYLSGGVNADLFRKTLEFAKESGSMYKGVLCGRSTWAGVVKPFVESGEEEAENWLKNEGTTNIVELNKVLN